MDFVVCSVYDSAVMAFSPPFCVKSSAEALRGFQDAVRSDPEKVMIAKHPEDYALFELGKWSDDNARFEQFDVPRKLMSGETLKER